MEYHFHKILMSQMYWAIELFVLRHADILKAGKSFKFCLTCHPNLLLIECLFPCLLIYLEDRLLSFSKARFFEAYTLGNTDELNLGENLKFFSPSRLTHFAEASLVLSNTYLCVISKSRFPLLFFFRLQTPKGCLPILCLYERPRSCLNLQCLSSLSSSSNLLPLLACPSHSKLSHPN